MDISKIDFIFYTYEFIIVCGLIFRCSLGFENDPTQPTTSLPQTPEPIVIELDFIEEDECPPQIRKHPTSKKEYIDLFIEALQWCEKNIKLGKKRKISPLINVSFSRKGDLLGYYEPSTKKIMIYVYKHESLRDNIETFIHEYVHHLQLRNINDNIRYDRLTNKKGYYYNDYEIEARELSYYYLNDCCDFLNIK